MASTDHLSHLLRGADAWKRWREDNPNVRPDLRGANLEKANLAGYDLSRTNFEGANLSNANLSWVNATEADFPNVDLSYSRFIGADLGKVDLRGAKLANSNGSDSFLVYADLTGAVLADKPCGSFWCSA